LLIKTKDSSSLLTLHYLFCIAKPKYVTQSYWITTQYLARSTVKNTFLCSFIQMSVILSPDIFFNLRLLDRASLWHLKNKRPNWCHLLFYFTSLCAQHVSDINISIISSLRLFCLITTLFVLFLVIQQNSRKLLMMDILMSETCWAHKKWNKVASDIKLVFYSSIFFNVPIFKQP